MVSIIISFIALTFSAIALYFTFKKDAHRLRLSLSKCPDRYADYLSINNDSSFSIRLSSIGYINELGEITWLQSVCEIVENKGMTFPIRISARETFEGALLYGSIKRGNEYGYCVQLDCGRTFFESGNLNKKTSRLLRIKSLISRVTSGNYGFVKNQIHIRR